MTEITWANKVAFYQSIAVSVLDDAVQKRVLPSLSMAQAALESDYGNSVLASKYNNLFGIKGSGSAGSISLPTTEYDEHGNVRHVNASFAVYASQGDSIAAHTQLFHLGTSDDPQRYVPVLDATTPEEACKAVYACGYATDPNYTQQLLDLIQVDGLTGYDDQYREKLAALANPPVVASEEAVPAAPEPAQDAHAAADEESSAIAWAQSVGLLHGDGSADFGAGEPLKRGHFAIVLKRLHDLGFLVK